MNQFEEQADKWWENGGPFDLLHINGGMFKG